MNVKVTRYSLGPLESLWCNDSVHNETCLHCWTHVFHPFIHALWSIQIDIHLYMYLIQWLIILAYWLILIYKLNHWLIDWLILHDWLIDCDWFTNQMTHWIIDKLISHPSFHYDMIDHWCLQKCFTYYTG